jgi:hypothetical protein
MEDTVTLANEQYASVQVKVRPGLTTSSRRRSKLLADMGADRVLGRAGIPTAYMKQKPQDVRGAWNGARMAGAERGAICGSNEPFRFEVRIADLQTNTR